ncbi:Lysine-specific demethylase 8 [Cyphellophora attinorum]|uniref:Lysine-specific demethylase 8 n=1 Tax=Cyphellophora attinorum TaxID=1664694 RepID=A0A0N0NMT6_9EURO|nr:Lysine-specific demethylase 8 [Phialophora attinorum]KPI40589.1 Lysine-specific demethylase 8 [Phialophora attinorum]
MKRTRNDNDEADLAAFLDNSLEEVAEHDADDPIHDCEGVELGSLEAKTDEYFDLADKKIRVFPFSEVKPCWFRLYTDTSIIKAVRVIEARENAIEDAKKSSSWLQDAVGLLDMALITAGGLRREEFISRIFLQLESYVDNAERKKHKRFRHEPASEVLRRATLPELVTSVPKIKHSVTEMRVPTLEMFSKWLQTSRKPVKLLNTLDSWSALTDWKQTSYWMNHTLGGRRLVPIETGRSYTDSGWGQKIITFGDFLYSYIFTTPEARTDTGYLAQHDLFRQLPSLEAALLIPDYCYMDAPKSEPDTPLSVSSKQSLSAKTEDGTSESEPGGQLINDEHEIHRNIWFGPAWTITPLHHDPYHNILCQVVGTKYVRLYSPHDSGSLQSMSATETAPHEAMGGSGTTTIDMSNTSKIDVAAMELSPDEDWDAVYPGISKVPYWECILEPGDALYLPVGWWHYVRSCSVGISVSFWW